MAISIQVNNQRTENESMFGTVSGVDKNRTGGKSIFVGNLNQIDPIEEKRKQAQQKAFKVVSDAWENDQKIDESIRKRQEDFLEQADAKAEAKTQLAVVEQNMKDLQEAYGVEDDSAEQKDLLILEKYYDTKNGVPHEELTEEESKRLVELFNQPMTEYQKAALELNDQAGMWRKEIENAKSGMEDDIKDIKSIERERLKSHPMVDAQKEADGILAAADKEILGMLVQEGTDHIDDKFEEEQEKAKEREEEEKQEEERQEKIEEKRAIQEALIEGTKEAVQEAVVKARKNDSDDLEMTDMLSKAVEETASDGVGKSLDEIKNSMKLLEADLKGIKVDETV